VKALFAGMMCISLFCQAENWKFVKEEKGMKTYIDTDATLAEVESTTVVKITNKMEMPDGAYIVDDRYYKHDDNGWSECLKKYVLYGKKGKILSRSLVDDRELKWFKDKRPYKDFFQNIILIASPLLQLPIEAASDDASPSATELSPAATQDDRPAQAASKEPARIRLFGQNGIGVAFNASSQCYDSHKSITVSGGVGDSFKSFFGNVKNQSIGMPATVNVTNLKAHNGILSKAYYREYEIPSNVPMAVRMVYGDGAMYCDPIIVTFVAQPGEDYEGYLQGTGHYFKVVMNKIVLEGEAVGLVPVDVEASSECRR